MTRSSNWAYLKDCMRKTITRQGIRAAAGADQFFQHCTNSGLKTRFVTKITKANKRCEFTLFFKKKRPSEILSPYPGNNIVTQCFYIT